MIHVLRVNLARRIPAFFVFVAMYPVCADEARALLELVQQIPDQWPNGEIEYNARSPYAGFRVKGWWDERAKRVEYQRLGGDNIDWIVWDDAAKCTFVSEQKKATIERAENVQGNHDLLRVRTRVHWAGTDMEDTTAEFLQRTFYNTKTSPIRTRVTRRSNGGYRVERVLNGIVGLFVEYDPRGYVERWDSPGTRIHEPAMRGIMKWKFQGDRATPHYLRREFRPAGEEDYYTSIEISVIGYRHVLSESAPSMEIPPSDLPSGTLIVDRRNEMPSESYVGGKQARLQFHLEWAGRLLRELEGED